MSAVNASAQDRANELDVAGLPSYAFSHHSLMWWGNAGLMLIEGTVFALCIMIYFYLASHASSWPMSVPPPNLSWGTLNTVILLVSILPNLWVKRAAEQQNLGHVRIAITICLAFALAFLIVRIWEFKALNCRWDTNAYGSIVWLLLALHTTHLLTDALDTTVLAVLMFTGPLEGKRFVDVSENAIYWDFVVLSWLPIYGVLYWAPRLINGGY